MAASVLGVNDRFALGVQPQEGVAIIGNAALIAVAKRAARHNRSVIIAVVVNSAVIW